MRPFGGHPSVSCYNKGCRCKDCRVLRSAYVHAWRHKKAEMVANGTWVPRAHRGGLSQDEVARLRKEIGLD